MDGLTVNLYKVLVIGDVSAGKTSLIRQFMREDRGTPPSSTVGVDFSVAMISVDGEMVQLHIWDTAGQERYRSMTKAYYRGANGVVLVVDLSRSESVNRMSEWVNTVRSEIPKNENVPIIVACNKIDIMDKERLGTIIERAGDVARSLGLEFIPVSAVNRTNIDRLFNILARKLILSDTHSAQGRRARRTSSRRGWRRKCC